ncbi:uncharacterized protein LOC120294241 [Eucalyptus grandis]|uniref:uncharacterized protein LOC120294241 n=1 Tax=Eucalyptus grandis TaxID=71139 RepID=UPI00192F09F6|nr:uncharacterized protein LOC120294241 [Eucalyptus grandis]
MAKKLPCGHGYHGDCIVPCRTPLAAGRAEAPAKHLSLAGEEEEEAACRCRILEDQALRTFDTYSLLILNISFHSSLLPPAPTLFASVALCINASRVHSQGPKGWGVEKVRVREVQVRGRDAEGGGQARWCRSCLCFSVPSVMRVSVRVVRERLDWRLISCSVFLLKGRVMDRREIGFSSPSTVPMPRESIRGGLLNLFQR